MSQLEKALVQKIRSEINEKQVAEAFKTSQQLTEHYPNNAQGWWLSSVAAGKLGNWKLAMEAINRALLLQPSAAEFLVAKANIYIATSRLAEAVAIARELLLIAPEDPQILDRAGAIFNRCEDYTGAMQCYEKAIKQSPENSNYHYNLATVKRFLGDDVGAESALNKAVSINPQDYEACYLRSDLRTQKPDNNHIQELENCLRAGGFDWRGDMTLCFALAKECEDVADYSSSFTWLKRACDMRRKHMAYRVENDLETIEGIIDVFSSQAISSCGDGDDNNEAIFIVGLPRTGTTLVERILSNHDQVYSAGELNNFALQLTRIVHESAGRKLSRMELLQGSANIDVAKLGCAYIESTRTVTGQTPYFIDKMPLNYLYCGLIHQALPHAKIIHVTRNPMDACYAMYKRLFKDAYPMSYNLEDLGRYYLAYRSLMRHWTEVLPGAIYPIAYEQLVNDQEQTSRQLIAHCGLDWQQACLQFEQNSAPSTTASATQVRQPMYHTSVGKWRNYSTQLVALQAYLSESGVDIENDPY